MTNEIKALINNEYKTSERIFNGKDEGRKVRRAYQLYGFIKALGLTNNLTEEEWQDELSKIDNMY